MTSTRCGFGIYYSCACFVYCWVVYIMVFGARWFWDRTPTPLGVYPFVVLFQNIVWWLCCWFVVCVYALACYLHAHWCYAESRVCEMRMCIWCVFVCLFMFYVDLWATCWFSFVQIRISTLPFICYCSFMPMTNADRFKFIFI